MQDDGTGGQMPLNLRKFICYANKAIWSSIKDFDEAQEWRMANELLPGDGNLCDAPSMQMYLDGRLEPKATIFRRSDGKGEPMWIHREDLAEAIEKVLRSRTFSSRFFRRSCRLLCMRQRKVSAPAWLIAGRRPYCADCGNC